MHVARVGGVGSVAVWQGGRVAVPPHENNKLFRRRQQQIVQIVYANSANCRPAAAEAWRNGVAYTQRCNRNLMFKAWRWAALRCHKAPSKATWKAAQYLHTNYNTTWLSGYEPKTAADAGNALLIPKSQILHSALLYKKETSNEHTSAMICIRYLVIIYTYINSFPIFNNIYCLI